MAFTLRYLEDWREAAFVGVHPHRITQISPGAGLGYHLTLDTLEITQDFQKRVGPFGGDRGDFGFAAGHKDGPYLTLRRGLADRHSRFNPHRINHGAQLQISKLDKRAEKFGFMLEAYLCENSNGRAGVEWQEMENWRNVCKASEWIDVTELLASKDGTKKLRLEFAP